MRKRFVAIISAAVLCLCIVTVALAAPYRGGYGGNSGNSGYGFCGGGYSLMWDEDGNFLDQASFEENIDSLIDSGLISAEDRDFYLERYEWCAANGGGATGVRGGCGGRGMGMYR